ncbi:MAG TPA: DUF4124 domain-containing protein, partial [Labilithrix sp.]|nr:DUF4124 domain-containing protein [Labilithrix sp.]
MALNVQTTAAHGYARARCTAVVVALVALPAAAAADQSIYSYTDAEGVIHFTSKPAQNAKLYV